MMMIEQDIFECSNCGYEMDENYIVCPKCKEFGTIKFLKRVEAGPCQCDSCKKAAEKRRKHFNHPFYALSREEWIKTQQAQIEKGAEKYPEPFTPSSWSNEQLVEHAIQENVDQLHYIVGMKERMEQQEQEIKKLKEENKLIDSVADSNAIECERLRESEKRLMNENETLEKVKNSQIARILDLKREVERLEKENRTYKSVVKDLDSENRTLKGEF